MNLGINFQHLPTINWSWYLGLPHSRPSRGWMGMDLGESWTSFAHVTLNDNVESTRTHTHTHAYYIILYYVILCFIYYIYFYYIILYHIMLYYILFYYIILYFILLYYILFFFIILYYVILYYIILYIYIHYYIYIYVCIICVLNKTEYPAISGPTNNEPIDAPGRLPDMVFIKVFAHQILRKAGFCEFNRSTITFTIEQRIILNWVVEFEFMWIPLYCLRVTDSPCLVRCVDAPLRGHGRLHHGYHGATAASATVGKAPTCSGGIQGFSQESLKAFQSASNASHEPKERLIAWLGWWREGLVNGYWRDFKSVHEFSND